ncbi:hypothetical protein NJB14197_14600 [Mycobacterium montefiorense]|uniref:Integral membrane protein n=2 Tax=Mycobacterium montefiorense TaxID=154654 RepID=A0AA37UQ62_9MYCO|nr:hypothetical protein MmonteBS_44020 [Mycobacterium montefiorense]GKU33610.1 hypothetical protein NJB14191_09570 [Mycobacterium montefiorense]GKU39547.1 hypothetical protein NJB14192_15400 [Mycobacterium montefiorense]GKU43824.1 hypothetical protein NJB14194_04570 [Mycobacterium montefiorense]GKU52684.1 hypothetical protein NJB14195_39260 [Mycobacterium montefiorense]
MDGTTSGRSSPASPRRDTPATSPSFAKHANLKLLIVVAAAAVLVVEPAALRVLAAWDNNAAAPKIPYMSRAFVVTFAVGLLVAAFGLIWALQGFGVLGGSPMSNTTTWSIIGPITVVIGIVIAVFSWRKISSK